MIDAKCYIPNERNPVNEDQECIPSKSTNSWSASGMFSPLHLWFTVVRVYRFVESTWDVVKIEGL